MRFLRAFGAAAVLASASTAGAQAIPRQFTVTPRGGYFTFDKASGIKNAAVLGIQTTYHINRFLGVAAGVDVARPQTNGDYFVSALTFQDTTYIVRVHQPITIVMPQLNVSLRLPNDMISPYITAGAGTYSMYLDAQQSGNRSAITRMASNVAAGFDLKLADRVGVTFEARDAMFSKFKRSRLNPIAAIDVNNRFTEDFPIPPAEKSNLNNFMFTLGFTFAPQGRRDSTDSGSTTTGER
ncbi:MAG TPA: outer membrane beta-barrel protein [Gemmatimonadaceae bacterium]|nr:outer membrane beta-barrel protein [Gemmatimonadaceae bacterium]